MSRIGNAERRRFDRDGFLVFEELIGEGAVRELRDAYDRILEREVAALGSPEGN